MATLLWGPFWNCFCRVLLVFWDLPIHLETDWFRDGKYGRVDHGLDRLYFFWRSEAQIVMIRFENEEDDEFLKKYLELHPSSL